LDGDIKIIKENSLSSNDKDKIIELLKSGGNTVSTFNQIRQIVADNGGKVFDDYYSHLYKTTPEFSKGHDIAVTLNIAEYLHQSSLVVDKEITFMACIASILKTVNK
jgi:hypothetical protein